ncbi:hypothetical protein QN399_22040 [Pseudomonas sp. 10C3]|uniref:hypothetical protein n=1 Tax=Pseudomonas sp. 10C3 TaxID=3118753 RepID=UPI002E80EAE4|nr:hypothetical protein [Pseudomonas sp. 10C3]MEE3508898.1 hypothetical protein [Pseudomonas sp. 10C3]
MKLISSFYEITKRKKIYELVVPLLLLVVGMVVLFLRNPDPLINPVMYAEDGTWSALALREGWWHALINSRDDYFVFINTLILFLSSKISLLFSGNPLALLPQAIAVTSFLFFSGVATLSFLTVRRVSSSALGVVAFFAVIFIPLGTSQNEIIGRALQVGFYMPLIAVLLLFWRDRVTALYKIALIDFLLLLCAATNPFVFAVCFLYLSIEFLKGFNIRSLLLRSVSLVAPLTILLFFLLPRMGSAGGIQSGFFIGSLVEVLIARSITYPFLFPWYGSISDATALIAFSLLVGFVVVSYFRSVNENARSFILLLSLTVIFYSVATVVMRPGLTLLLSNYKTTFPDRYFMGINVLVVLLFIICAGQIVSCKKLKFLGISFLIAFISLYFYGYSYIFEWSSPGLPIKSQLDFSEQMCASTTVDETSNSSIPIYPYAWRMIVPSKYIDKENCMRISNSRSGFVSHAQGIATYTNDLAILDSLGSYKTTGVRPFVIYKLSSPVQPKYAEKLLLDLKCANSPDNEKIQVQVFWATKASDFSEKNSVAFPANQGITSIDIAKLSSWIPRQEITDIRIGLFSPNDCPLLSIRSIELGVDAISNNLL